MVSVNHPAIAGFGVLTRNRERKMPHDRDKIMLTLDGGLEDSEAVVRGVKCHPLDASDKGFRDTVHAGIITNVLEDPMRLLW